MRKLIVTFILCITVMTSGCSQLKLLKVGNDELKTSINYLEAQSARPVKVSDEVSISIEAIKVADVVANEVEMEALQIANRLYIKLIDKLAERNEVDENGEFVNGWITRRIIGTGQFTPFFFPSNLDEEIENQVDDAVEESDWWNYTLDEDLEAVSHSKSGTKAELNKRIRDAIKKATENAVKKLLIEYNLKITVTGTSSDETLLLGKRVGGVGGKSHTQEFVIPFKQKCVSDYATKVVTPKSILISTGKTFESYEISFALTRKSEISKQSDKAIEKYEEQKIFGKQLEKAGDPYGLGGVGKVIGGWLDKKIEQYLKDRYAPNNAPVSGTLHFTRLENVPEIYLRTNKIRRLSFGRHKIQFAITSFGKTENNARRYYDSNGRLYNRGLNRGKAIIDTELPKWDSKGEGNRRPRFVELPGSRDFTNENVQNYLECELLVINNKSLKTR